MSEYQYYEFVAIDQPLTAAQQRELRAVSTRGRISPSSFVNDYEWGDLKADPRDWMGRYFDAFLYLANWGTRRVALRLPLGVLSQDKVAAYCDGDSATAWSTATHVIIDMYSEDEGDEEWWDQEGMLAAIVPVRAELAAGDHRLLYLAWLLCVQNRELDEDAPEPPVPPGLARLTGPQQAFAAFLRLDADLLAVAAEASAAVERKAPSPQALSRWVKALPEPEKDRIVLRLLRDGNPHLRSELLGRFHGPADEKRVAARTAGELLAAAETLWEQRRRRDQARAAAERERREKAAAAAREARLLALAGRQEGAWQEVEVLIETKRPKEYDSAVELLIDLRAVAERAGDVPAFRQRVRALRERHVRKVSLVDRLDRQRLA